MRVSKNDPVRLRTIRSTDNSVSLQNIRPVKMGAYSETNERMGIHKDKNINMVAEVIKPYKVSPEKEYEGPYVVDPLAYQKIILRTQDKIMRGNVTVNEVPYYETRNDSGTTVFIATEVQ